MTVPFMHHHVSKQTGLRDTVVLGGAERWDDKQCLISHVCSEFVCSTNLVRMVWWR